jgi:hypothetical protein
MDHKKFQDNISSYLSGDLTDKEAEDFEIHSLNCLTCRDALLFQKTVDLCIKDFIKTAEVPILERVLNTELFLKEIQKDQAKDAKVPLVELIKDKLAGLSKRWNIIERIESLKSGLTFPLTVAPLGATRGAEQQKNAFSVGQSVLLSLEPPQDGYVAVFHYDSQGNLRLIFPRKKGDVSLVKSGEEKRITMKVTEPIGKQWLKAVFFQHDLIKLEKLDPEDESSGLAMIEGFLDALPNLKTGEWMETEHEFEVVPSRHKN